MFKLKPFMREYPWGYENWIVSVHPHGQSLVQSADGKSCQLGTIAPSYPLLIKIIHADKTLSVQVHPDDAYARVHEHSLGKSECWYILRAEPDAALYCGFSRDCTAEDLRSALVHNTIKDFLLRQPVQAGDFVYVPAGMVHALGKGIEALEIQESSDITYRLYDWGRGRELHIEQGLQVITYDKPAQRATPFSGSFACPYFSVRVVGDAEATDTGDFVLFVQKAGMLRSGEQTLSVCANDTVFCRGGETVQLYAGATALCITLA